MGLLNKFKKETQKNLKVEILESLTYLLSIKTSFGAWQKGLGLDDYSYSNQCHEMIPKIIEDICANITQYEKRFLLSKVTLVSSKSLMNLCFELEGTIEGNPQMFYLYINRGSNIMITTNHC
jgi:hypothetical protein